MGDGLVAAATNAAKAMRILVEIAEDIKLEGAPVLSERLAELETALARQATEQVSDDAVVERVADWLNAFKADPFATGRDKAERCIEVVAAALPNINNEAVIELAEAAREFQCAIRANASAHTLDRTDRRLSTALAKLTQGRGQ